MICQMVKVCRSFKMAPSLLGSLRMVSKMALGSISGPMGLIIRVTGKMICFMVVERTSMLMVSCILANGARIRCMETVI